MRSVLSKVAWSPADDLLSDLVAAQDGAARLSEDEVVASAVLLLNAGHEASVNVFGNGATAALRRGLRPAPGAEFLRKPRPGQRGAPMAVRAHRLRAASRSAGVSIPAGGDSSTSRSRMASSSRVVTDRRACARPRWGSEEHAG